MTAAIRLFEELHKDAPFHDGTHEVWAKEPSPRTPFRFDDGTRFFMARDELAGWDEWTTNPNASPERPDDWEVTDGHHPEPDL